MSSVREIADLKSPEPIRKKLIELNDLHAQINKLKSNHNLNMLDFLCYCKGTNGFMYVLFPNHENCLSI